MYCNLCKNTGVRPTTKLGTKPCGCGVLGFDCKICNDTGLVETSNSILACSCKAGEEAKKRTIDAMDVKFGEGFVT